MQKLLCKRPQCQPAATGALVIDKPLRSGQQVYARGRDLVVLAMVNPGAEVIADGHIHVYAPLRGKRHRRRARQRRGAHLQLCLEAELVSIAGIYRTGEDAAARRRASASRRRCGWTAEPVTTGW